MIIHPIKTMTMTKETLQKANEIDTSISQYKKAFNDVRDNIICPETIKGKLLDTLSIEINNLKKEFESL